MRGAREEVLPPHVERQRTVRRQKHDTAHNETNEADEDIEKLLKDDEAAEEENTC